MNEPDANEASLVERAATLGATLPALTPRAPLDELLARPERFGFFQAVRLLYRAHGMPTHSSVAGRDKLRFSVPASLSFPTDEIASLSETDGRFTMVVNFLGLTGPSGILPLHYTEAMIARHKDRDTTLRDFFDIFNQRLLSLFWQAWAKHRTGLGHEFGNRSGVLRHIYDIIGVGTPSLYARIQPPKRGNAATQARLPAAALGYYSGLVAQRPHGVGALAQVVADLVGAPANVTSCLGTWQPVPKADRTRLGLQGNRLGDGCLLGARFWDRQSTCEVRVGPLDRARFDALLPDGKLLPGVVDMLHLLGGLALDLRIRLAVRADALPRARLGQARLGWNIWLDGRRDTRPASECHFDFSMMRG